MNDIDNLIGGGADDPPWRCGNDPATFEECATDWNSCGGCATYQHDISYHDAATFEVPT